MEEIILKYDDNYESCSETFVTLRIYSAIINPDKITNSLKLEPSEYQVKGDCHDKDKKHIVEVNGWFLTSKGFVKSKDCRRHIDYLTEKLLPVKEELKKMIKNDFDIDFACFWLSENGQGGPTISSKQMEDLAELGIELWFDFY